MRRMLVERLFRHDAVPDVLFVNLCHLASVSMRRDMGESHLRPVPYNFYLSMDVPSSCPKYQEFAQELYVNLPPASEFIYRNSAVYRPLLYSNWSIPVT